MSQAKKDLLEKMAIKISPCAPKAWWPGDQRVEPFMGDIRRTLDKYDLPKEARTDIYNRSYEAVYDAIKRYDKKGFLR